MSSSTRIVDVPQLIDGHAISGLQIRVIALCALVVAFDGFDAQAIGYVAPTLSKAWGLGRGALGPAFGAGLFGLMIGALVFGPVADWAGRKRVIIACAAFFGICSLLTAASESLPGLMILRFLTGLGLGGVMPNAIALTSEYSPRRSRAMLIMIMFAGFSFGAAMGGVIANRLVPGYGWQSVFWVGGIAPLVVAPLLAFVLPESIHLLVVKGGQDARIRKILHGIDPALAFDAAASFVAAEEKGSGFLVKHLYREGRGPVTVLLWVMFFMNLLDIYFLVSWLPTVINAVGLPVEQAAIVAAVLQIGGIVGTFVLGGLMERIGAYRLLGAVYVAGFFFIAAIGWIGNSAPLLSAAVFLAGFCVVGAQIGCNAIAATYYPTFIRSTGVGWALGVGRIGSIVGPVLGGYLLALQWQISTIFIAGAVPQLCAAVVILLMSRLPAGAE